LFAVNFPQFKQRGWVRNLEFQMIRKDGTLLPVSLSATAILDEADNFRMSRSVVLDISDRKRTETSAPRNYWTFSRIVHDGGLI
jgi:PAS domain S-box-containing protein